MPWKNDQVSETETDKIIELAKHNLVVEGDYVEFGCYRGDTSLLLAEVLKSSNKRLWIYDSFEGLPEKTISDSSELGLNFVGGALKVTKREVKERFLRAGLPVPIIKKAWFSELKESDLPKEVSFAFLDGDFYESIKDSLRLIDSRMNQNGIIVVHDYNNPALPGVAKAVDEWVKNKSFKMQKHESMLIIML